MKPVVIKPSRKSDRRNRVLRVIEHLAEGPLQSGANAAVTLIEGSPLFQQTLEELDRESAAAEST